MNEKNGKHLERMLFDVDWAIRRELGPRDLIPMLNKLLGAASPGSDAALFAKLQLAEVLVQAEPWRAASLLRDVLKHGDDERAWALLGLAHTLLGNYRCAARAYTRALALTPDNPWYAHNFGHVLDVALDRPRQALPHLRLAHRKLAGEPEVASSYAHALLRAGRRRDATRVLERALRDPERAQRILTQWLESAADADASAAASDTSPPPAPSRSRRKRRAARL